MVGLWVERCSRVRPPGGFSDREARWQSDFRCRHQSKVLAVDIGICYNQTTWRACLTQLNELSKNPSRPSRPSRLSGFLISNFVEGNALGVIFPLPRLRRIRSRATRSKIEFLCSGSRMRGFWPETSILERILRPKRAARDASDRSSLRVEH